MRAALDRNLCRCGAHNRMVRAVLRAARRARRMSAPANGPHRGPRRGRVPGEPRSQSAPVAMAARSRRTGRRGLARQGGDRAGDPDRARADRRGRARCGARAASASSRPRTAASPNEGVTSGSLSVQDCGLALRYVCAEARALFLAAAAERLGVPAATLDGRGRHDRGPGNARTSYWELADDGLADRDATCRAEPKPPGARAARGHAAAAARHPGQGVRRARASSTT